MVHNLQGRNTYICYHYPLKIRVLLQSGKGNTTPSTIELRLNQIWCKLLPFNTHLKTLILNGYYHSGSMAFPVMEFQDQGYKIRKIFA